MKLLIDRIESPMGVMVLITNGDRLCALDFADYEQRTLSLLSKRYRSFELVEHIDPHGFSSQLRAYLAGDYASLQDSKLDLGGTDFQQLVWQELRQIPVGKTITYGELAVRIGKPTAARAVGMANSLNPIAIVVPCHRVIGAGSKLTGYAGGLTRKQWLLAHEGVSLRSDSRDILTFDRHPLTSGNA
ncbi:methylated-DNA--[protein]-cysteine S-methyltransferase, partial [Chamaesiphon sp. VAR_69_metabat_338]|uniref:methylated-DNA--[protein]-cysteine S-methyltransferase n=1 Tax=Chamaesiphon sp. VAR_69_metabat_338 TaxID=2964704 RepID=UPI00286E3148